MIEEMIGEMIEEMIEETIRKESFVDNNPFAGFGTPISYEVA